MQRVCLLLLTIVFAACSHSYYVVRHAEKEGTSNSTMMMTSPNDPSLSDKGKKRAEALKEELKHKHIRYIFSTNTNRTLSTAAPISKATGIKPIIYEQTPDAAFINKLLLLKKNVLVIGHSNTIDDIVNGLCKNIKVSSDLQDSEYNNLFIVTYKGKKIKFRKRKYGEVL